MNGELIYIYIYVHICYEISCFYGYIRDIDITMMEDDYPRKKVVKPMNNLLGDGLCHLSGKNWGGISL